MRRVVVPLVVLLTGLVLGATLVAAATDPTVTHPISACVNNASGAVRVASPCKKGETTVLFASEADVAALAGRVDSNDAADASQQSQLDSLASATADLADRLDSLENPETTSGDVPETEPNNDTADANRFPMAPATFSGIVRTDGNALTSDDVDRWTRTFPVSGLVSIECSGNLEVYNHQPAGQGDEVCNQGFATRVTANEPIVLAVRTPSISVETYVLKATFKPNTPETEPNEVVEQANVFPLAPATFSGTVSNDGNALTFDDFDRWTRTFPMSGVLSIECSGDVHVYNHQPTGQGNEICNDGFATVVHANEPILLDVLTLVLGTESYVLKATFTV